VLYYLAGLTCTEETFSHQGACTGRGRELGLMLVAPDTSPREPASRANAICGFRAGWPDLRGRDPGALVGELPHVQLCHTRTSRSRFGQFARTGRRHRIFGHSMGGHGALNPRIAQSGASTGPCRHSRPSQRRCKPFGDRRRSPNYLGPDQETWRDTMRPNSWRASPFPLTS